MVSVATPTCPKCDGPMFRDRDHHGAFWYCLCGFYRDDIPQAQPVLRAELGRERARWEPR